MQMPCSWISIGRCIIYVINPRNADTLLFRKALNLYASFKYTTEYEWFVQTVSPDLPASGPLYRDLIVQAGVENPWTANELSLVNDDLQAVCVDLIKR